MTNTLNNVASIRVSPGIGVGRVGNSSEYFIGPETPNVVPNPGNGQYKDNSGAIKPQAQRFRVFGYDNSGNLVGEITQGSTVNGNVVNVQWQVHVTNMKSANYAFQGKYAFNPDDLRNSTIQPGLPPAQRDLLIIDPGEKNISGLNQGPVELLDTEGDGSTIFNIPGTGHTLSSRLKYDPPQTGGSDVPVTYTPATVSLGNLYTDDQGRLIFVGGKGVSESCTTPQVVISKVVVSQAEEPNPEYNGNSYFNNPGWYDDTCGGSINVVITNGGGGTLFSTNNNAGQRGWIAIAPPHYAPASNNVVSLLDLQLDLFPASDPYTGQGPVYFARTVRGGPVELATSSDGSADNLSFNAISEFTSNDSPAVAYFRGKTYVSAYSNTDQGLFIGSSSNATDFNFKNISNAPNSYASTALSVLNNQLYVALVSNGMPYLGVSDGNNDFTFNALSITGLPGISNYQPPALTTFNGSLFYAVVAGLDVGELIIASSIDGSSSNFEFQSLTLPHGIIAQNKISLTTYAGKLYCAFVGTDFLPYLGVSSDGQTFTFSTVSSSIENSRGVSITAFNGQLYYAFTNVDNKVSLLTSSDGVNFTQQSTYDNSNSAPEIATAIPVNFYRDIYPILRTVTDYAWTNERAFHGHRPGTSGDFLDPDYLSTLANPNYSSELISRPFVFDFIRPPAQAVYTEDSPDVPVIVPPPPAPAPANITAGSQQQRADLMPRLFGNGGSPLENNTNGTNYPNQWLPLTDHQLEKFQQWVNGNFVSGQPGQQPWQDIPIPDQLDFAALQPTVGGGFHPGIELTYLMHESAFFAEAFRFTQDTAPGSIAAYMSVPWQGDFWSCNISWWPALRPDIVVERNDETPPVLTHIPWFRSNQIPPEADSISDYEGGYSVMVETWKELGFVTPVAGLIDQGQQVYEETERNPALDTPSVLTSINASQVSNNKALSNNGGSLTAQPINTSDPSQHWQLIASASSAGYLFIQEPGGNNVLTVDFSTGNISLAPKKVPQDDSQLWQYTASGYPGHFTLTSSINLELLSVQADGSVSTAAASSQLQQLWLLQASG